MKKFTVATGERLAKLGGGVISVITSSTEDTDSFRRGNGFRTDCLEAGRFYWKGSISFSEWAVGFNASAHTGAESNGIVGFEYQYLVFNPVFDDQTPDYIRAVIVKHVMGDDYQSMLLKEHNDEA